ncbi:APC family permease [Mycobacterium ahvazicum]|uniref:APC family permease n=1 Tax=Mycobacterium ahvazicum TaxID=1964395 RepID=A0A2K4YAS3_9MYCO|nr:APC family permease [Mycobacterium ahvazicum]
MSKGEVMTGPESGTVAAAVTGKGLRGGALGLLSSVVVGLASMAPAYSLAATLGLIVASGGAQLCGVKAPAVVLISFIPMYLIATAYQELNRAIPDCGTTFTWASRAFGPIVGWLGGWGIIAAEVIVMANLAEISAAYSFRFAADLGWLSFADGTNNGVWPTVVGVLWIATMTYICYRGIQVSARLLHALLAFQIVVLVVFSVVALVKTYTLDAQGVSLHPSLSWFWPGGLDFGTTIAPAALMAIFMYWGWDTAVACNEESDDPSRTPGRAAIISALLLLATYTLVTVSAIAFAGVGTQGIGLSNPHNSKDTFAAIGPALFGDGIFGRIALLLLTTSIMTSALASAQTTILKTARTTLSMGVFKALPASFAKTHHRYLTPTTSTVAVGVVSVVFYVLFTLISENLLAALIGSVGLMIAFYYGLTGFACAWYYRNTLTSSVRNLVMRGVIPLLGGVTLLIVLIYGLNQYARPEWLTDDNGNNITILGVGAVAAVGIGALLLGSILMVIWWAIAPDFFPGRTMTDGTAADSGADVA